MGLSSPEFIRAITSDWTGERFPDGRPRVSDSIVERMKLVTIEEAWGTIHGHGYQQQFAGDWMILQPERTLVGRAVTGMFVPSRPDLQRAVQEQGQAQSCVGGQNSWVIDTLQENDVIVIDLFGKVKDGTFAGDNLGNSIYAKTKTGMVIEGGVRDLQRLNEVPMASFVRGVDPTAIRDVTLLGINIPVRIGKEATVIPGDIVLGTVEGVVFIPAHLAEQVVVESEETRLRDEWGHAMLREGRYLPGQVDGAWTDQMNEEFQAFKTKKLAEYNK
ncbi:MAG: RraA family protein [candidate division Zixibacteria bacterium]|nr:RraA family protein [candidate division Zixibacteria bacterium]